MIIIPAIDILNGGCVRLLRGDYAAATRYDAEDPVERARAFFAAGVRRIHIVDLDAARGRGSHNREIIRRIRREVPCVIQVGGGIRTEEDVAELLDMGVDRLIPGTVFAKDPGLVARWVARYGGKFIAGIDARDGKVKTSGWTESGGLSDLEAAKTAADVGACSIVYTNIERDGTLEGPDIRRTLEVAREAGLPVILSGGVSGDGDVHQTARLGEGRIVAAITGKAVYEGRLDLASLVRLYPQAPAEGAPW